MPGDGGVGAGHQQRVVPKHDVGIAEQLGRVRVRPLHRRGNQVVHPGVLHGHVVVDRQPVLAAEMSTRRAVKPDPSMPPWRVFWQETSVSSTSRPVLVDAMPCQDEQAIRELRMVTLAARTFDAAPDVLVRDDGAGHAHVQPAADHGECGARGHPVLSASG